ncbi:MAG: T9SS type A sorting domain-containing protein [Candidatus Latescibacteria bacterium]|nr:T9SS type A sorting domain-containing protein [Candidatus Latescibacterota bacterium]
MATLEVPIERVPTDISLELFDLESGVRRNLREQSTYKFFNSREHRFMIIAGSTSYVDEVIGGLTPSTSSLGLAFPNPFNTEVLINYRLSRASSVRIELYNIAGQHVKTVFDGVATAGYYKVRWNGTNSADMPVASGTYFVRMRTEVSAEVLKILLLR